jgi:hypothetical protein
MSLRSCQQGSLVTARSYYYLGALAEISLRRAGYAPLKRTRVNGKPLRLWCEKGKAGLLDQLPPNTLAEKYEGEAKDRPAARRRPKSDPEHTVAKI